MVEDVNENEHAVKKLISNHSTESVSGLFIQAAFGSTYRSGQKPWLKKRGDSVLEHS